MTSCTRKAFPLPPMTLSPPLLHIGHHFLSISHEASRNLGEISVDQKSPSTVLWWKCKDSRETVVPSIREDRTWLALCQRARGAQRRACVCKRTHSGPTWVLQTIVATLALPTHVSPLKCDWSCPRVSRTQTRTEGTQCVCIFNLHEPHRPSRAVGPTANYVRGTCEEDKQSFYASLNLD